MEATTNAQNDLEPAKASAKPDWVDPFIANNPESRFESGEGLSMIVRPWGDPTLILVIKPTDQRWASALPRLRFPPRLTAAWHLASKDLEVIWGPVSEQDAVSNRSFEYTTQGKKYRCEFAAASEEVKALALAARPMEPPSHTDHRNLLSMRSFLRMENVKEGRPGVRLTSFFVRSLDLNELDLVDFARRLNFFMKYFDRETPWILIHEEADTSRKVPRLPRLRGATFPAALSGRRLEPNLLGLWETANVAPDSVRRFLYSYQVLEYASFYYLKEDLYRTVRRVLAAPDLPDRLDEVTHQLLDTIVDDRVADDAKVMHVVQECVQAGPVWNVVSPRVDFFAAPTDFEGGFCAPAIAKCGWSLGDFETSWIPKVPDALRKIRNAIVHSREQRLAKSIVPSLKNRQSLRPWADLVHAIATEVVAFEGIC